MRLVVQYLVMVGLLLIGLLVVLRLGEDLVAPRAIGGDWRLQDLPQEGCPAPAEWSDPGLMTIVQSGQFLDLDLGGAGGLNQPASLIEEHISAPEPVEMSLVLVLESEPQRLQGDLRFPGCDSAQPVVYILQPAQPESSGGAH